MITSNVADTMAMSLVYSSIFECTTTDTLMAYVVFREKAVYEFDSLACGSELQWNGVTCDSSGVYQSHFTGANGCDSTVIMHLSVNGDSYSYIEYSGCRAVSSGTVSKIIVTPSLLVPQRFHQCPARFLLRSTAG